MCDVTGLPSQQRCHRGGSEQAALAAADTVCQGPPADLAHRHRPPAWNSSAAASQVKWRCEVGEPTESWALLPLPALCQQHDWETGLHRRLDFTCVGLECT